MRASSILSTDIDAPRYECRGFARNLVKSLQLPNCQNRAMHILDFHAPDCVRGWSAIDDRVMGGVSTSQLVFHPDGHAVFTGVVSTDRGGGFASVRHPALSLGDAGTVGYGLQVRGDGKRYKFNLRMDAGLDGINYQAVFEPPGGVWVDIVLPLHAFSARARAGGCATLPTAGVPRGMDGGGPANRTLRVGHSPSDLPGAIACGWVASRHRIAMLSA